MFVCMCVRVCERESVCVCVVPGSKSTMAYFHLSHLQPQILLNSIPTVGMQNGCHRKATRGSCEQMLSVFASLHKL